MTDRSSTDLPEHARSYLDTIDLQIAAITDFEDLQDDYEHALADQVATLRELKELVKADPSICSLERPQKRPADTEDNYKVVSATRSLKRSRIDRSFECSTCLDPHPRKEVITLKCCGTIYCTTCVQEWFSAAISTKQLPKCCEVGIVPTEYRTKFTRQIITQYKALVKEIEAERRLWCANMACRAFIKIDQDSSGCVKCTKCRRKTCVDCAGSAPVHKGRRNMCPNHLTDEALESAMVNNQWKRCPGCHVVVEKNEGCNNISCTCGVMFCFRCGDRKRSEASSCECTKPTAQLEEPARNFSQDARYIEPPTRNLVLPVRNTEQPARITAQAARTTERPVENNTRPVRNANGSVRTIGQSAIATQQPVSARAKRNRIVRRDATDTEQLAGDDELISIWRGGPRLRASQWTPLLQQMESPRFMERLGRM